MLTEADGDGDLETDELGLGDGETEADGLGEGLGLGDTLADGEDPDAGFTTQAQIFHLAPYEREYDPVLEADVVWIK